MVRKQLGSWQWSSESSAPQPLESWRCSESPWTSSICSQHMHRASTLCLKGELFKNTYRFFFLIRHLPPLIPPHASQSSWTNIWETSSRTPDGKTQWLGLWKVSSVCLGVLLSLGSFGGWHCSYRPVCAFSTQPMDLLGFSAFPEDLKPTPIVLHVNQHCEVLTHVGFIRDDIPSSWEKEGDYPEI